MLLAGIAGVSAANVGTAGTQFSNTNIVHEKVNKEIIGLKSTNKSTVKQNKVDKIVNYVKKTFYNKHLITPKKNSVKQEIHSTKNSTYAYSHKTSNTKHKSDATNKSVHTVKQKVKTKTNKTALNSEKTLAAGEPKEIKKRVSNKIVKPMAAGAPTTVKFPKSLRKYLKVTRNCQANNPKIKRLAYAITKGKKTRLGKAVAIFNWVRNHVRYRYYYNTKRGALGTLNARKGNCADTTHLLVALERAVGIPARYIHGKAKYRSGKWYGHVWAGVHVNGRWYKADATGKRNSFGVTRNWKRCIVKGKYASLPF